MCDRCDAPVRRNRPGAATLEGLQGLQHGPAAGETVRELRVPCEEEAACAYVALLLAPIPMFCVRCVMVCLLLLSSSLRVPVFSLGTRSRSKSCVALSCCLPWPP